RFSQGSSGTPEQPWARGQHAVGVPSCGFQAEGGTALAPGYDRSAVQAEAQAVTRYKVRPRRTTHLVRDAGPERRCVDGIPRALLKSVGTRALEDEPPLVPGAHENCKTRESKPDPFPLSAGRFSTCKR
ncbi:MAG: hypothetical protein V2A79_17345, partial [Planctomycetota bacterium]